MNKKPEPTWQQFVHLSPQAGDAPIEVSCPAAKDPSERHIIDTWTERDIIRYLEQPHGWTHWRHS